MSNIKVVEKTQYRRAVRKSRRSGKRAYLSFLKTLNEDFSLQCVYCGDGLCRDKENKNFTVDHIVPLSKGGSNHLNNMAPCCLECNQDKKHHIWPLIFQGVLIKK